MLSVSKLKGWSLFERQGLIRLNTTYVTEKKHISDVLLKVAGLLALLALATAMLTPALILWLPPWKATLATIGIVLIYLGVSFFIRPQTDKDNLVWESDSKNAKYASLISRSLMLLHWLLAPGRFAAETLLDACTLMGLARGAEVNNDAAEAAGAATAAAPLPDPSIPPPSSDRDWDDSSTCDTDWKSGV